MAFRPDVQHAGTERYRPRPDGPTLLAEHA